MSGGRNNLAGKKGRAAPEFICGKTRILARHSIVQTHRVVNCHGPQFISDSTLGTVHDRVNHYGADHAYNHLDSKFGYAVLIISTRSTKVDVLVLFN